MTLLLATISAGTAEARAQSPLREAPRQRTASVPVCTELPNKPLGGCRAWVGVPVALDDGPQSRIFRLRTPAELRLNRSIVRGTRAAIRLRFLGEESMTLNGLRADSFAQFQLTREMFFLLARVTGEVRILRAGTGLTLGSSVRAFAESEAIEKTRRRATFIQIEEFLGPNSLRTLPMAQAGFAVTGASFFMTGILAEKLLNGALAEALEVHPQPWPPGIVLKGRFNAP